MKSKTIFGLTKEQIKKLSGSRDNDKPPMDSPIRFDRDPLDACISGSEKILNDSKKREMFYRIYRRERRKK